MKPRPEGRILFPLDQGDEMVEIEARPHKDRARFDFSLQHGGFLFGANGLTAQERQGLCQRLVRLIPCVHPYEMDFTPQDRFGGRSYELAALVLHARTQADSTRAWPSLCATGKLAEQGAIEPIEALGLKHKLQQVLALDPPPDYFLYPQRQEIGAAEAALLQQMQHRGIQTLAIDHLDELPETLIGRRPAAASPGSTPDAGGPNRTEPKAKSGLPRWVIALLALSTLLALGPIARDLLRETPRFPKPVAPPTVPQLTTAPQYHLQRYLGDDAQGQPQWAERAPLAEGARVKAKDRLFLTLQPAAPGHYYAFLLFTDGTLGELFRAEGRERYLAAGETVQLPQRGLWLDATPGELRSLLIALPAADPTLQEIVQALPPEGATRDPDLLARLQQRLLQLPAQAVQRFHLIQP